MQIYQELDIHHIANLPRWLVICHTTSPYATIIIKLLFSLFPEKYTDSHHAKLTGNFISTAMYKFQRQRRYLSCHTAIFIIFLFFLLKNLNLKLPNNQVQNLLRQQYNFPPPPISMLLLSYEAEKQLKISSNIAGGGRGWFVLK